MEELERKRIPLFEEEKQREIAKINKMKEEEEKRIKLKKDINLEKTKKFEEETPESM